MHFLIPTFDFSTDFRIWGLGATLDFVRYGGLGIVIIVGPFFLSVEW